MTNTRLALMAALIFAPLPALAAETCPAVPFDLRVVKVAPTEGIDRSLDSVRLGSMLTASSLPGYVTQGLTQVDYTASYTTEYESRQRPEGRWCSNVRKVTVNFGFVKPPKIYVSSSVPYGGCLYNEVLKHEYQHLAIARETLAAGQKYVERALRQTLSGGGTLGPTPDTANAVIDGAISDVVNRITSGLYTTAKVKNMALDTPANYARLGKACR